MKANEENLLKFLDGKKQFILPIFQRRYSWEREQCNQLWEDVVRVGENEDIPSHFLGSIVSIGDGSPTLPKFLIVDGQQRLTTISLLLSALGKTIESKDSDLRIDGSRIDQERLADYLFNHREDGERRYKQLLTQHDKDTLIQLLENGASSDPNSLLVENLRFFEDKLKRANLEVVYRGIEKLMIVDIALDSGTDNPQLIFESLNSTGLRLSQADLIRNYVLMVPDHNIQTRLYQYYWYPMEQRFGTEYAKRFDLFIRDYLTLKTGHIPNKGKVYESFKRYVDDKRHPETLEKEVEEIVRYSKHYVRIVLLQEPDRELRSCFEDILTLSVEVTIPFLLGVYEDYTRERLERVELIEILRMIESFVFRRAICALPSNSLNKVFAPLILQIEKDTYLHSLKSALTRLPVSQRFPLDDEFFGSFLTADVYNLRSRIYLRSYILGKLENHERKEPVHVKNYTIEHIMPQTLTDEWRQDLGENSITVHEKYLHTIGNLTLTGYNPELSNNSLIDKQLTEGGFLDSPLRLNASLREVERWDEHTILERAEILAEKACLVWHNHGIRLEKNQTRKLTWTLEDHPYLIDDKLEMFKLLQSQILHLDSAVHEKINKRTIAYSINSIFVDIVPQAKRLLLSINLPYSTINDPEGRCKDVTDLGRWGMGDVEVAMSSVLDLEYIMSLIHQAYERQISADQ